MKYCGLVLVFLFMGCQSPSRRPSQAADSQSLKEKTEKRSSDILTLDHKYFVVKYDPEHRLPQQVEYMLNKSDLIAQAGKRKNAFKADPLLEKMNLPTVKKNDIGGDYDRGHMAPADDFKRSQNAIDETFVMTNIAPQKAELNQQAWRKLEALVQGWACGEDRITVITGPVLKAGLPKIASQISIPEKFFKAVYDLTPPQKSICFIYDQNDGSRVNPEDRMMSVEDCEKVLGFNLGSREHEGTERNFDFKKWRKAKCS